MSFPKDACIDMRIATLDRDGRTPLDAAGDRGGASDGSATEGTGEASAQHSSSAEDVKRGK